MGKREEKNAIIRMMNTDGWKLLEKWLKEEAKADNLMSVSADKFAEKKAEIRAYRNVLGRVNEFLMD